MNARVTYEMNPFEREEIDELEGRSGRAFPTSQSSWEARIHNCGGESGTAEGMRFAEQMEVARRANENATRSSLDIFLSADDYGEEFGY